jgi:Flp pilus assembly protein TadG
MALLTTLLLGLLMGIIEFGRFAYYSILVGNAAREGAQYGSQNLVTAADTTGISNAATEDGQSLSGLNITVAQKCGCTGASLSSTCPATGCTSPAHPLVYVQVTASATVHSLFNYPGIPSSMALTSTNTMRVAQ